ncbi:matrixin family metalloprotease [Nocardioides solisilvae]|uniref:matrixin family metalloprotease n=1 Tax=Nocardioides solisilvae TaxID=1542435 RepID=UPI000D7409CB|nr:matrixin family metalloprotease [Nocardioides solisilvae]
MTAPSARPAVVAPTVVALAALALAGPLAVTEAAVPTTTGASTGAGAGASTGATASRVVLRAPQEVAPRTRFAVRGTLRVGSGRRTVTVSERVDGRWRTRARARTTPRGTFRLRLRSGAAEAERELRLRARGGGRLLATSRFVVRVAVPKAATAVTTSWSAPGAALGIPLPVTGLVHAPDAAGRTAVLQAALPSGWFDLTSTVVAPDGSFALAAPTDWLASLSTRVLVPETATSAEGASTTTPYAVTPTWTPPGAAGDWTELGPDLPLRHDPCRVVDYRTNLDGAPSGAAEAVAEAVRQVALATGLRFRHLGPTAALFDGRGPHAAYPSDATLVVGFGTAAQTHAPFGGAGRTIGWGGASDSRRARSAALGDVWRIVEGGAVLRADHPWQPAELLEALTHEIGHAVGLGHASGAEQLMFPVSDGANVVWGAGDLAGLRTAGLQAGCLTAPRRSRADDRPRGVVALP